MNFRLRRALSHKTLSAFAITGLVLLGAGTLSYADCDDSPSALQKTVGDSDATTAFQPTRTPDYTKITGSIENADLPVRQPEVLWKTASEVVRNGKLTAVALSSAVVADGVLYFGDDSGNLTAYDIRRTAELWTYAQGSRFSSSPSIDAEFVYCTSEKGVAAVRRETGEVVWEFRTALGATECIPLPVGDHLFFACYNGNAFDIESGEMRWKLRPSVDSELFTDPVTDGRLIFVTSRQNSQMGGEHAIFAIGLEP